jgi:hypothetical protein
LAALRRLCQSLEDGVRSSSWDVSRNVARVRADGHLGAGWLERLVAVVLEDQNLLGLEDWPAWGAANDSEVAYGPAQEGNC